MPLEQLGPYKIGAQLGRGGMGSVFAAENVENGERAAVKVLSAGLARDEAFRERFDAEIETLRQLRHPNIVQLFGFGEQDGVQFFSMELVEGQSLDDVIRGGRKFTWQEALDIGLQICRALKHAHDRGVVHRDIKPANLLLTANGMVKLSDFGISKFFGAAGMTAQGGVLGTAEYMSPEQADGRPATHRCDLYSLGGVLYALVAGRPPFLAKTIVELLQLQRFAEPEPLRRFAPGVPAEFDEVIAKLLQKNPENRIPTAMALARRLEAIAQGELDRAGDEAASVAEPSVVADRGGPSGPAPPAGQPAAAQTGNHQHALGETQAAGEYSIAGLQGPGPAVDAFRAARADFNLARDLEADAAAREKALETQPLAGAPGDNGEAGPDGATAAARRYTAVEKDSPAWYDLVSETRSPWRSPQTWLLVASVVASLYAAWYYLKPPTADELYARIGAAAKSEDDEDLTAAADDVDRFLERFPDDDRRGEVEEYRRRIELWQLQRRFEARLRVSRRQEILSPVEKSYAEALRLVELDPDRALCKFRAMIDLYGDKHEPAELVSTVRMARQQVERLEREAKSTSSTAEHQALVEDALDRANQLADSDPPAARKLWAGIVELYDGKSWAAEAVKRARKSLEKSRRE